MTVVNKIRFILDGCDISFCAEAPEDMTLKQLLKQCDRIRPDWCACGIRTLDEEEEEKNIDLIFNYNDVQKTNDDVCCKIEPLIEM